MADLRQLQKKVRSEMHTLKFKCELVKGSELKPGDLFSNVGDEYWNDLRGIESIGERVYIRTEAPASWADDEDARVYRITVLNVASGFRIKTIHAVIAIAPDGDEGIPAWFHDGLWMPLIAADEARLKNIIALAREMVQHEPTHEYKLAKFSVREDVEVIKAG